MVWEVWLIMVSFVDLEKFREGKSFIEEKNRVKNRVKNFFKGVLYLKYLNEILMVYDKKIFEYMSLCWGEFDFKT